MVFDPGQMSNKSQYGVLCFANGICYSDNHKIEFARLMAQAHKHLQKQQQSYQINSACFPGKSRLASYPSSFCSSRSSRKLS